MSILRMLNPAYWYLLAAKAGVRILLIAVAVAVFAWVAVSSGAVDVGSVAGGMFRSLFGV